MNEFRALMDGYRWRQKRKDESEANWVAHLMNATGKYKEPMTGDKLLGKEDAKTSDRRARVRARAEKHKRDRESGKQSNSR
jgi:hypothetical protein